MGLSQTHPDGHVFYRRMAHSYPVIDRGEGVYLYDTQGKRYLDASGGAVVAVLGHGLAEIAQVMAGQAGRAAYVHGTMFTSQALEEYANALAQVTPITDVRFFPLSSGSEAVETAIKVARQAQMADGYEQKHIVIGRWGSYHGTTLGALAVSGRPRMRKPYLPMIRDMPRIPPPYCFRCPFRLDHPDCDMACAHALEEIIRLMGPENVAAFIAEPISGASLGAAVPPPGYWPLVREICDRYSVLVIADEVMTGFGRTGRWFAIEQWDVSPDILVAAKGASGGYFPLSLTGVRGGLVESIRKRYGDFAHGGTFSHHAVGSAVGLAVLRYLQDKNLVAASAAKGDMLGEKLATALSGLPVVGDIRGEGLMWGVEFVADRQTKRPFRREDDFARRVADAAFEQGLIVYPSIGCVDGILGDLVMVAPPLTIGEAELDVLVTLLSNAIVAVSNTLED